MVIPRDLPDEPVSFEDRPGLFPSVVLQLLKRVRGLSTECVDKPVKRTPMRLVSYGIIKGNIILPKRKAILQPTTPGKAPPSKPSMIMRKGN